MQTTLEITGLNHTGEGVGRLDGQVVFVPQTAPGDLVKVNIIEKRKKFLRGEVIKIIEPSQDRCAPICPHAFECGGCQFQHINYEAQLRWKRQQVEDALHRIGHLEADVLPVIGMEDPSCYRNKAQIPVRKQAGDVVIGFYRKGSNIVVNMEECMVQHPLIEKLAFTVRDLVQSLGIEPYNEEIHRGILRHAVIRASFSAEKLMLILVTRAQEIPHQEELIAKLCKAVPELVSIAQNINKRATNLVFGPTTRILWGEPYLYEQIGNREYAISPRSFFQVNSVQTKILYDLVADYADLLGNETLLDLYCGTGTIGLYLANKVAKLVGVETVPDAISDARLNAEINTIKNTEFLVGKAEKVVPGLVKKLSQIDCAIVDPPRKGCDKIVLDTLSDAKIDKIVYVSCNPATLARDLAHLVERGYKLKTVQPVDMFPWTSHVETVCLLTKK